MGKPIDNDDDSVIDLTEKRIIKEFYEGQKLPCKKCPNCKNCKERVAQFEREAQIIKLRSKNG